MSYLLVNIFLKAQASRQHGNADRDAESRVSNFIASRQPVAIMCRE